MDKVRIRNGLMADREAIERCIEKAYISYVARIGRRPASMDTDFEPLLRDGRVWVLECEGTVAALMVVVDAADFMEVRSVAVLPQFQRQGFGRRLMLHAEHLARETGRAEIRLYTNARIPELVAYYARLGYRETERKQESGYDRVFMMKSLERPDI